MNAPRKPETTVNSVSELPDISTRPPFFGTGVVYPALGKTEEEREAALAHLFSMDRFARPLGSQKMTRDEMHER